MAQPQKDLEHQAEERGNGEPLKALEEGSGAIGVCERKDGSRTLN